MDIEFLVKLTSKAWAIPILAHMGAGVPGRQATLIKATGASRSAFAQSLSHLHELTLTERNSGHGHPLRPEYQLTPQGAALAGPALSILELAQSAQVPSLIRRMWILPLLAKTQSPQTFSALSAALPLITDRALSQALQRLQTDAWMDRDVDISARPPRTFYRASGTGARISAQVVAMLEAPQIPSLRGRGAKGRTSRTAPPTLA